MIANTRLFWILAAFFVVATATYTIWAFIDYSNAPPELRQTRGIEWVGTIGLGLAGVLSSLIAFYLGRIHAAQGGELPEDTPTANIDDGDAEQGFFSPWSWWPIMLAAGVSMLFLGVSVGIWIAFIGIGVTGISLVGWTFEYYRGNFGR